MNRKKNSIRILAAGMEQFEAKQQQADFSTLETFLSAYLNTVSYTHLTLPTN